MGLVFKPLLLLYAAEKGETHVAIHEPASVTPSRRDAF